MLLQVVFMSFYLLVVMFYVILDISQAYNYFY